MTTTRVRARYVIAWDGTSHRTLRDGEVVYRGDTILFVGRDFQGQVDVEIDGGNAVLGIILATLGLGVAILTEAILSFLGLGMPPTQPSLGALIRVGNDLLLSGEWWISMFPGLALVLLVLSVNVFGDRLRNALNPRLK